MTSPTKALPHLRTNRGLPDLHQASDGRWAVTDVPLAVPDPIFDRKHATSSCVHCPFSLFYNAICITRLRLQFQFIRASKHLGEIPTRT
jgi:hypothetical protein